MAAVDKLICKRGARKDFPCSNIDAKREQAVYQSNYYGETPCSKCCDKCVDLAKCKNACPMLAEKAKKLRANAKAQRQQEKRAQEEKAAPIISEIRKFWNRFGEARNAADKTVKECYKALNMYWAHTDDEKVINLECLEAKFNTNTPLPYGYSFYLSDAQRLVGIADLLGCSLDYLFCRTADPNGGATPSAPAEGWVPLQYLPGKERPTKAGQQAVALFSLDGKDNPMRSIVEWNGSRWCFPGNGATIDAECVGWFPLPEYDEE